MRCFYVLKKWSSTKLSLNRDLSLNKMSLQRDCTVLEILDKKKSFYGSMCSGGGHSARIAWWYEKPFFYTERF